MNKEETENLCSNTRSVVLLLVVFNKNSKTLTHDIFYNIFSSYGRVEKMLIFGKNKLWKSFVEMETVEQAEMCRQKCQDYPIFNDGSNMKIYFSKREHLIFQNDNSGGVDYTRLRNKFQENQHQPSATQDPQIPEKVSNNYKIILE